MPNECLVRARPLTALALALFVAAVGLLARVGVRELVGSSGGTFPNLGSGTGLVAGWWRSWTG